MCAGHDVSADGLTWTFTLRDGLTFHDGERVLAKDCAMSVRRWGSRDSFGQPLMAATNEIETIDDRRFRIRLKRPFSQMLYGLAARGCFMMPERMAKIAWHRADQGGRRIGTIPLPARCMGFGRQRGLRAVRRICAAPGTAELPGGRQGGECPTCRMGRAAGPGDRGGGAANRRGRLARGAADRSLPDAAPIPGRAGRGKRSVWLAAGPRAQPSAAAVQQSEAATGAAAGDRPKHVPGVGDRGPDRTRPGADRLFHRGSADVEPLLGSRSCPDRATRLWRSGWCWNPVTPAKRS